MSGCEATSLAPIAPMAANHTTMSGPNTRPTTAVPERWTANRTGQDRERERHGEMRRLGAATLSPSTAESTEIAGVMMLSP